MLACLPKSGHAYFYAIWLSFAYVPILMLNLMKNYASVIYCGLRCYKVDVKYFQKYFQKYLVVTKKSYTFVLWRGGRVVDCGGLENRCAARHRGFESLPLRQ